MADWQFKLDLKDAWDKHDEGEMSIVDVAKTVVERSKALVNEIRERGNHPKNLSDVRIAEKLLEMANEFEREVLPMFEEIVEQELDDPDDFDNALEYLYDWADTALDGHFGGKKMCWVATIV